MKKKGFIVALFVVVLFVIAGSLMPAWAAPQSRTTESAVSSYSFRVEIDGVDAGEFASVDGLSIEQEVIEYQNGDDPLTRKRPGRINYGDITLKKGLVPSSVLNDWIEQARFGNGDYTRKVVSIVLIDKAQSGEEIKRWNCFECFPKSWKVSSLDGKGNDVLTEEVVIVIEYFEEA